MLLVAGVGAECVFVGAIAGGLEGVIWNWEVGEGTADVVIGVRVVFDKLVVCLAGAPPQADNARVKIISTIGKRLDNNPA